MPICKCFRNILKAPDRSSNILKITVFPLKPHTPECNRWSTSVKLCIVKAK